jgi:hypothetical protein
MKIGSYFAQTMLVAACLSAPLLAHADDSLGVGVALTAGLSGIGVDAGVSINPFLGVRATVAGINVGRDGNYGTSVDWNASARLFQAGLLLDGYPWAGSFHLTGGLVDDGNKITLNAQPSPGGTYTFNGTSYPTSDISAASATVNWGKAVPYVGLGWGDLASSPGLHFTTDIGVLISSSPSASINVVCASNQVCANLGPNVAAEQSKLQNDVNNLRIWPVVRFGVGFAF